MTAYVYRLPHTSTSRKRALADLMGDTVEELGRIRLTDAVALEKNPPVPKDVDRREDREYLRQRLMALTDTMVQLGNTPTLKAEMHDTAERLRALNAKEDQTHKQFLDAITGITSAAFTLVNIPSPAVQEQIDARRPPRVIGDCGCTTETGHRPGCKYLSPQGVLQIDRGKRGKRGNVSVRCTMPPSPEQGIATLEVPAAFRKRMEDDCSSCRLNLPGHPCGHYWVDGVRYSSVSDFRLHRLAAVFTLPWRWLKDLKQRRPNLMCVLPRAMSFVVGLVVCVLQLVTFMSAPLLMVGAALMGLPVWLGLTDNASPRYSGDSDQIIGGQRRHPTATTPPPVVSAPPEPVEPPKPKRCGYCEALDRPCPPNHNPV